MVKPKRIRLGRWARWIAGLVCVTVVGVRLACLTEIDPAPHFRTAYGQLTRQRWTAATNTPAAAVGPLRAGFSRVDLTPDRAAPTHPAPAGGPASLPLAGYGARKGRPAQGVHDRLHARAIALDTGVRRLVFVGADALIIPLDVAERVRDAVQSRVGLRREEIYFGATHTHASFGGWAPGWVGEQFAGPYLPQVPAWFSEQLVAAIEQAVTNLAPAALAQGRFAASPWVRNRLVGDLGRVDPEFSYLVVRQDDGPVAILGSYAAHATVLPASNMAFSGDYPGAWSQALEDSLGGVALFVAGAVGSHGPAAGSGDFEGAERMGQSLARQVQRELAALPFTNRLALDPLGVEVELPTLQLRITDRLCLRPWVGTRLIPHPPRTWIQAVRVADRIWISTPCDFSGELAAELKAETRARGMDLAVTSFNGDYVGYVIPARYFHLEAYESRTMAFFGPTLPELFVDVMRALAGRWPAPGE